MSEPAEKKPRPIDILEHMASDAPVFVGFSPRGPVNKPFEIKRWGQFIVKFGSFKKCGYLATSAKGFFLNGGKRFITLNLGERPEDEEEIKLRFKKGLEALDSLEDVPFIIAPGEDDPGVHEIVLDYCEKKGVYAVLDGPEELIERAEEEIEEDLEPHEDDEMDAEPEREEPSKAEMEEPVPEHEKYVNLPKVDGNRGVVVYPWIYLRDRVLGDFYIPPSGHVAGILCRLFNEDERPEFSKIEGTVLLKYKFPKEEIDEYSNRGISFLRYPTKDPALMLGE